MDLAAFVFGQRSDEERCFHALYYTTLSLTFRAFALARKLGHDDAGYIKTKMRIALQNLRHLSETNDKFKVKCYSETPNFKILLFDDVMFVSSFGEGGGPKNDQNARMWQMTREGNPIFIGLEKHFDKLWECSVPPQ